MKYFVMLMLGLALTNVYADEAALKETVKSEQAAADKKEAAQQAAEKTSKHDVQKTQFLGKRPYMAVTEKK